MIDLKILKDNPTIIAEMLEKRNLKFPLNDLFELDKDRRESLIHLQEAYHQKNLIAKDISIKKKNNVDIKSKIAEMNDVGSKIKILQDKNRDLEQKFKNIASSIPNFFDKSVPFGKDENDNKVIRVFNGKGFINYENDQKDTNSNKYSENVFKIKNHVDLSSELDLIDLERAAKISGARFYFLKNDLVRLGIALSTFALDYLINKNYIVVQPPYMIKREAMEGAVILSDFEETIYKIDNEDLYMIGTSEHALASMHMDEILNGKQLPLKYTSISPCFRKEAGAHGKDMKGIFRVHQFEKVEQFIFCKPEESWKEHDNLLNITEKFYEALDLPFRTIVLCTGDLGKVSAKTFDIEAWFPAQNGYREICSCSNCTDYQSRSLKIRYRDNPNEETQLVHTLNSTLVAVERTLVAILENYQTSKGTIEIPTVLQKYMNDKKEIGL